MSPKISVVIPVKNGGATIERCLKSILRQTVAADCEILVIDSDSRDNTLEILSRFPVRLLQIPAAEFNHGETRNFGARQARGEFVVMTVQDAYAADDRWLERMLAHFDDEQVAGVCGQQIVPHDAAMNPLAWFRPYERPVPNKVKLVPLHGWDALSQEEQALPHGWDNVTAMYRRRALLEIPFRRVDFLEDSIWAKDALLQGKALVYDYSVRVCHYHHESVSFRFRRRFTNLYYVRRYFDHVHLPASLLPALARIAYRVSRRKYCPSRRVAWLLYNVRLEVTGWLAGWLFWLQAKFGGNRAVERGHALLCAKPPQPIRPL